MRFSIKSSRHTNTCTAAVLLSLMISLPLSAATSPVAEVSPTSAAQVAPVLSAKQLLQTTPLDQTYEHLLPLQGGSNFRDLGGYVTTDNKQIKRGLLFRSGVMSQLTSQDEAYLARFKFRTVLDLRSTDELELYPNHWAANNDVRYFHIDYSMLEMMNNPAFKDTNRPMMDVFYRTMPLSLKPQLTLYFDNLIKGNAPIVVNCSAGQDRTGLASALLLSALGVPREQIYKDYLLSTQYRRPAVEMGDVDLAAAAKTNAFAGMMLRYQGNDKAKMTAQPLMMPDSTPFLQFAFEEIESKYGSVENYLNTELGVSERDIKRLKKLYLN